MDKPLLDMSAGHVVGLGSVAAGDAAIGDYAPPGGDVDLRCIAAEWYGVHPGTLAVTTGASMALSAALASYAGPKRLLCPRPYYPLYLRLGKLFGFDTTFYDLRPELGWQPDPGDLWRLAAGGPGVLLVNWPGNPTGSVASTDTLDVVARLRDDAGFEILSDETYGEFSYDGSTRFDVGALIGRHGMVQVKSCSKLLQTPGERIGFAIADPERMLSLCEAHWTLALSPPVSGQCAALRRFAGPLAADLGLLRIDLQQNRDRLISAFNSIAGLEFIPPAGGLFLWARADPDQLGDFVAGAGGHGLRLGPGAAFGARDPSWFRTSFAVPRDVLEEACQRLRQIAGKERNNPVIAV